jgi:hypothetical protein
MCHIAKPGAIKDQILIRLGFYISHTPRHWDRGAKERCDFNKIGVFENLVFNIFPLVFLHILCSGGYSNKSEQKEKYIIFAEGHLCLGSALKDHSRNILNNFQLFHKK